jgi:DUF4097 and DUF4098 domain-containing protein YvlB
MKTRITTLTIFAALLLIVPVAFAGPFTVKGDFTRSFTVSGPVELDGQTGSGDIHVTPGDSATVKIIGHVSVNRTWMGSESGAEERLKSIQANPPVTQNGNKIVFAQPEESLRRNVSIDYEIVVPAATTANLETGSGDVTVSQIAGPLAIHTGSGDVKLSEIGASVETTAGSGDLTVRNIKGSLRAQSGSGNIDAQGIAGGIEAHTGSGDIRAEQTSAGDSDLEAGSGNIHLKGAQGGLRLETGSGDVSVDGSVAKDWNVHTGSGEVDLSLPQQQGFHLVAQSSSGAINLGRPITLSGIFPMSNKHVDGVVGSGGATLTVRTGSGDISIH